MCFEGNAYMRGDSHKKPTSSLQSIVNSPYSIVVVTAEFINSPVVRQERIIATCIPLARGPVHARQMCRHNVMWAGNIQSVGHVAAWARSDATYLGSRHATVVMASMLW